MINTSIQLYLFVVFALVVIVWAVFYFRKSAKKKELMHSLEMVLYEITLPQLKPGEEEQELKEMISVMEQLYSGMTAVGSYFVFEIGLSYTGRDITFYASVEREHAILFEKQVQGLFPQTTLILKKDDYNVFRPEGFSMGSTAILAKTPFLPLKTYEEFNADPLQLILNTLSKLQKKGEGAAIQIIATPSKADFVAKSDKIIGKVRKGKTLSEALKGEGGIFEQLLKEIGGALMDITGLGSSKKTKEEKEQDDLKKPVNESLVKLLEEKASRAIMGVNIRLVASAENKNITKSILSQMESSFEQFGLAQGNNLKFYNISKRKLKDFFYKFTYRIPDKKQRIVLNTAELATIFHLPLGITSHESSQLKYAKTKEAPPPINLPQEGILFGKNVYRGVTTDVFMSQNDRRRHLYVIGQTGTGKSTLLKNMIAQDIEEGRGVCFIDPHGSDLQEILARVPQHRMDDVIYFNPADVARPMGLNMLEYDPNYPEQKSFIVDELLGIFNKLFDMKTAGGPMFEQYFRNAALLVMDSPQIGNTLMELSRVLSDEKFRNRKLELCTNPTVVAFWRDIAGKAGGEASLQNIVPYITSKFDTFLSNEVMRPIVTQEKSAFNFRDVMDSQKILLVNLSKGRLGDLNSSLLGLIIVGKLLMASLSRVDMPEDERKDFFLYIDEFQNVTTDSISTILSEARKYRLALVIAHQFIAQLEEGIRDSVFGNVGSMVAYRVGAGDGEFLEKQFEPAFTAYDLMNVENYNAYIKMLIDGQPSMPFSIKSYPFVKGDPEIGKKIGELSSLKYGRPREEVVAEMMRKLGQS